MRLHSLELTAFGPYARAQRIDFGRLSGSGLFLLEGPTGSGKTTILDAITFALYGGLAGDESAEDRLRSHFAAPDAEPSVSLEFSVRGVRHRVTRVPEHRRPKRRGDGFTTEPSRVHLERQEAGAWVSLSANKAEAGELDHRAHRAQPGAVHPGHAAAAGRVREVPAGRGRRPAGAAEQAVRHPAVRPHHGRAGPAPGHRGPAARRGRGKRSAPRCRPRPRRPAWTPARAPSCWSCPVRSGPPG